MSGVGSIALALVVLAQGVGEVGSGVERSADRPAAAAEAVSITGVVRGEAGIGLSHAQVTVLPLGRLAVSDAGGRFAFTGLPAGRFRLEFSRIGYAPASREVVVRTGGAPEYLEVTLEPSPLALPGVQITGTPLSSGALASARPGTQLHGRELERSLSGSLAQTLAAQPGIAVRYNGPGAAAPVVRGLSGDRVLVLQDGQRTGDLAGSADDHAVTIDPLAAQRVEVIRGPASLLYGNNALGGVVNVISSDIPTDGGGRAGGAVALQTESAYPGGGASGRLTVPLGGSLAFTARAGARQSGDVRLGGGAAEGGRLANTALETRHAALGIGHTSRRGSGGVTARLYDFDYGLPAPDEDWVTLRGRRYELAAQAELPLPSATLHALRAELAVQDYRHDELDPDDHVQMSFGLRSQNGSILLRQGALGPFDEGAWGVSANLRQYSATGSDQLTPAADSRALGVFGFQQLPLGTAALQLGGRLDQHHVASRSDPRFGPGREMDFLAMSGSVGVAVPLGRGVSWGASAARSFRAPTVEELFSGAYHAGTASFEVGDAGLGPEVGHGAELVLRVRNPRLNAELAAHGSRFRDFVFQDPRGDTIVDGATYPLLAYTSADAVLRGVEASAEFAPSRHVVLGLVGDLLRAERRDGTPLPFIPPARASLSLRWDDGRFSLGSAVRHTARQARVGSPDESPTDAYTLFDADAGLRFSRGGAIHSVTLRATNLTDTLYRDAASRIKDFAPNPGRNVALLYRVHF